MLRITLLSVGSEMGYNVLEWIYGGGVMDNMTAKVSCFARAYHHKNNNIHIFDDSRKRILCDAESIWKPVGDQLLPQ